MWSHVKNLFVQDELVSVCVRPWHVISKTPRTWIWWFLRGSCITPLWHFLKLLCLAQGGSGNYLANILITSHISHTAGGNKNGTRSTYPTIQGELYKFVSGANSLQHIGFSTVLSSFKKQFAPRRPPPKKKINLLMTAGLNGSFVPFFKYGIWQI